MTGARDQAGGPDRTGAQDRAAGALYGLAIGDALGMPTESLPRSQVVARYGALLDWFQPGAADQPLAPGLAAGTVTDDTEQALLLAGLLIDGGGRIDAAKFAQQLLSWEQSMRVRGSGAALRRNVTTAPSMCSAPWSATSRPCRPRARKW